MSPRDWNWIAGFLAATVLGLTFPALDAVANDGSGWWPGLWLAGLVAVLYAHVKAERT